jgi:thiol-disulfide isomerase/thioredoxin
MKFFFTCCLLILFFSTNIFAKSATVHITVKNFSGRITLYNPELGYDLTVKRATDLHLDAHQSASYTMVIDKPTYLILNFSSNKDVNCSLFLSPGDELFLTADFSKKTNNIVVTGKGSNNNQPEIFALTNMDIRPFNDDATPDRVIAAINKQWLLNKGILTNYIKVNKPSVAFIKAVQTNLQYFATLNYYLSSHNNINGKPKNQQRKWQKIQDSLFSASKLSNDDALTAYNYTQLIFNFTLYEPGDLWGEYTNDPVLFYKQWFHSDTARGKKLFNYAQSGILIKKVIDKYFTGKAAEYAYGQSIKFEFLYKVDYPSTILLFDHFKKKYPASPYIKGFSAPMAEVVKKQQQAFSSKTIFVADNGTKLNTFNDVLKLTKGKVALVDMWGTWCGPCREEIEKHAKQLRVHFKGKNVMFLYVANLEGGREKEWKKQIAYFQMEGMHILANPKLTADIMGKVKSTGYPTYIIVKKDGSYKQSVTKYPVNILAMIKEIEAAGS